MLPRLPLFAFMSLLLICAGSGSAQEQKVQRTAPMKDGLREQYRPVIGGKSSSIPQKVTPTNTSMATDVLVNNNGGAGTTGNFTQSETDIIAFGNNVVIGFNDAGSYNGSNNQFTGWSYSTNGGASFTDGGTLPTDASIGDAGDPVLARNETTGRIYLSTLGFSGASTIQMWRSDDNGVTWMAPTNATPGGSDEDKQWHTVDNFVGSGNGNVYMISRRFSGTTGIYAYRSTDHGATFSTGVSIVAGNQGAFIAVGPDHSVYAFWYAGTTLQVRKSTDFGVSYGSAVTVASGLIGGSNGDLGLTGIRQGTASASAFRSSEFPHVAINPVSGNIYVTYNNDGAGADKADVFLVQSTDGGTTWSVATKVNDDVTTTDQWQPTIAVTPDGNKLGIFYYSRQDSANNNTFRYYGRIGDISGSTVTFASSFAISDVPSYPEFGRDAVINATYMGDYNHAVATPGAFHVVWSDNRDDLAGGAPRKDPNVYYEQILVTPPNAGYVKGIVSSGGALSGVLVDFTNPVVQVSSTTDGTGYFKASASVEPGTTALLTIRAQKFGYVTKTETVTVVRGDTVTRNLSMTPAPSGTLQVHAYKNDLSGIRASVVVKLGSTTVFSDSTNATTGLVSTTLPTGSYDVTVDPPSPYGTRTFTGVVITASTTTPVEALVRYVIEPSPTAMRDTLAVGQTHGKTMVLTNTTSSSVAYQISDDNALLRIAKVSKPRPTSVHVYESYTLPKGVEDNHSGYASPDGQGGPDVFGYEWIDSDEPGGPVFSWTDITGVGTLIPTASWIGSSGTANADDGRIVIPLPFSFSFYGTNYDSLKLCTNGWVGFATASTNTAYSNVAIPAAGEPNLAIYPFWDDFDLRTSGTVHYYNDAGNNRFVVQYTNAPHYTGTTGTYTFQVIFNSDGTILCQYLTMLNTVTSATIGIENGAGTDGLMVVNSAAYMHDNLAIKFYKPNAAWLSESPTSGTIPGNSTQNITVTFDATGLTTGNTYNGVISIDPDHADVTGSIDVPASLKVQLAGSAVLILNKSTVTFPSTQLFTTRKDTITAKNGGSTTLNITSITRLNTDYSVTPASGTLAPGDSMPVIVSYTPTAAGSDTGRVIFLSNSSGTPQLDVILNGTGVADPLISVSPDSVVKVLAPNTTATDTVVIKNTGLGVLNWAIAETSPNSPVIHPTDYFTAGPELPKGVDDGRSSPEGSGGPDAFGYRWKDSNDPGGPAFSWIDISGTGTALDSASAWTLTGTFRGGDEGYYPVALPFSFSYYGILKDSVFIGSNGQVMFQRPTGNTFTNAQFPTAGGVIDNHLGAFWDDLEVRGPGRIYYGLSGSDFVIQYDQICIFNSSTPNYSFEVVLKPTGEWLYQYLNMSINGGTLTSASIGMENAGGTIGLSVVHNAAYVQNNLAVLFRKGVAWLDENPLSGSLNPGDSTNVVLTFDSNGLADGDYNSVLQITSNDATNNPKNVPVHMIVGSSSVGVSVLAGWNLVSNPVTTASDSVRQLFPPSTFEYAFDYTPGSGYSQEYLMENGKGYWEKFPANASFSIPGIFRTLDSIDVVDGWNIVGSISSSVDTSNTSTIPGGLRVSPFYGFNNGYVPATAITPGKGYWMKANGSGKVILSSTLKPAGIAVSASPARAFEDYSALTLRDSRGGSQTLYIGKSTSEAYEMPPAGPAGTFDARFDSQRMVEVVSADVHRSVDYPITIQSAAYPVTVSWDVKADHRLSLRDGITGSIMATRSISGTGQTSITSPSITRLVVSVQPTGVPTSFDLSQNFPNPFNPTTQIGYALPEAATVTLKVFDLLGQEVSSIATGVQNAGYYSIEWNGRNNAGTQLASGVYFYRLEAVTASGQSFRNTRKMTLMK